MYLSASFKDDDCIIETITSYFIHLNVFIKHWLTAWLSHSHRNIRVGFRLIPFDFCVYIYGIYFQANQFTYIPMYMHTFVHIYIHIHVFIHTYIETKGRTGVSLISLWKHVIQESLQFGIGLSTLIGSIFRLVTKAAFPLEQVRLSYVSLVTMLVIIRVFDVKVVTSSLFYFYCGAVTVLFCVVAYFYLLTLPISKECLKFGVTVSPSDTAVPSECTPILIAHGNAYDSNKDNRYNSAIEMGNVSTRQHKVAAGESKRSGGTPSMDLGTTHIHIYSTHTYIHTPRTHVAPSLKQTPPPLPLPLQSL